MGSSIAASRLPALALVVAAHALALAFLLELTRTHPSGRTAEESLTVIALLPAARPQSPPLPISISPGAARKRATAGPGETGAPEPRMPAPDTGPAPIDWAAEGAEAAARVARGEDQPGPRTFGRPPASPMFAAAPARRPGLAWSHARTHRVEALPGGVTVFNLNDHCAVALLWVVPFFGCTLDKIPPRGDLLDHMREQGELGDWKR
jgi:hypothetical protein